MTAPIEMVESDLREAQEEIRRLQGKRSSSMKRVYIAHRLSAPTREGIEANRARASRWVAWAARQGVSPCATWIVLTGQWDETPENRELGMACDFAEIESCHEIWICGQAEDLEKSTGMQAEKAHAKLHGVGRQYHYTADGEPPAGGMV